MKTEETLLLAGGVILLGPEISKWVAGQSAGVVTEFAKGLVEKVEETVKPPEVKVEEPGGYELFNPIGAVQELIKLIPWNIQRATDPQQISPNIAPDYGAALVDVLGYSPIGGLLGHPQPFQEAWEAINVRWW